MRRLCPVGRRALRLLLILLSALILTYFPTKFIDIGYGPFDLTIKPDLRIPVIPQFVLIYIASYFYWLGGFLVVAKRGNQAMDEFAAAMLLTCAVSCLLFILFPTAIVRSSVSASGLCGTLLRLIYRLDSPNNLFPSMHCLISWLLFTAVRGRQEYSKAIQVGFCIFSFLVFASTVLIKQHYLVDIAGGVLLAEIGMWTVRKGNLDARLRGRMERTILKGL